MCITVEAPEALYSLIGPRVNQGEYVFLRHLQRATISGTMSRIEVRKAEYSREEITLVARASLLFDA